MILLLRLRSWAGSAESETEVFDFRVVAVGSGVTTVGEGVG